MEEELVKMKHEITKSYIQRLERGIEGEKAQEEVSKEFHISVEIVQKIIYNLIPGGEPLVKY